MERCLQIPQERVFETSTDIENFHRIMPEHFKSLTIIRKDSQGLTVLEKIKFLGITFGVKTLHVVKSPDTHVVSMLDGPLRGTTFTEKYVQAGNGTVIRIDIKLVTCIPFRLFGFFEGLLARRMGTVFDMFVTAVEKEESRTQDRHHKR